MKKLEDLALLVGLLLTDGCVSNSRFIIFHNKSEVMHELFKQQVLKVFGKVHFTERMEDNGTKRTQVSSKPIVKKLLKESRLETFKRKQVEDGRFPPVKLPSFIKKLPESSLHKFLSVIFSADGSISLSVRWHQKNKKWEIRRRIELACKHPTLRKEFFKIIKNAGFSPRVSGNDNITIERKEDILRFAKQIRFVDGVKIGGDSKNWEGLEKNQILDLAVKTLQFTPKDLESFKSKEEVINFLKSFL